MSLLAFFSSSSTSPGYRSAFLFCTLPIPGITAYSCSCISYCEETVGVSRHPAVSSLLLTCVLTPGFRMLGCSTFVSSLHCERCQMVARFVVGRKKNEQKLLPLRVGHDSQNQDADSIRSNLWPWWSCRGASRDWSTKWLFKLLV